MQKLLICLILLMFALPAFAADSEPYSAEGRSSPYSPEVLVKKYTQAPPPPVRVDGLQFEPELPVVGVTQ